MITASVKMIYSTRNTMPTFDAWFYQEMSTVTRQNWICFDLNIYIPIPIKVQRVHYNPDLSKEKDLKKYICIRKDLEKYISIRKDLEKYICIRKGPIHNAMLV